MLPASQYPIFILDCWAEWCGPCRTIGPIIEQLAAEMKGKVVFGKLNVDENMQTANKYRISAIPTLMIFKNGKLIDQTSGRLPQAGINRKNSEVPLKANLPRIFLFYYFFQALITDKSPSRYAIDSLDLGIAGDAVNRFGRESVRHLVKGLGS